MLLLWRREGQGDDTVVALFCSWLLPENTAPRSLEPWPVGSLPLVGARLFARCAERVETRTLREGRLYLEDEASDPLESSETRFQEASSALGGGRPGRPPRCRSAGGIPHATAHASHAGGHHLCTGLHCQSFHRLQAGGVQVGSS